MFTDNKLLSIHEAGDPEYWRRLCPGLSIDGAATAPSACLPNPQSLVEALKFEGYVNEPAVFPAEFVARLRDCVGLLAQRGIPPAFAFVYDEFWLSFFSLAPFLEAILGADYQTLPCFWAWNVPPSEEAAGWTPHRDRPNTRDADGGPQSLTVWLPLSDATPLNGCMYVLPAQHDQNLQRREFGTVLVRPDELQNIRALPASAGSLLAWHQELLHWGSRASRRGHAARCSIALEFQRGDLPPFAGRPFRRGTLPSFPERVGMIGHLMRIYSKFQSYAPELQLLAVMLEMKFPRQ